MANKFKTVLIKDSSSKSSGKKPSLSLNLVGNVANAVGGNSSSSSKPKYDTSFYDNAIASYENKMKQDAATQKTQTNATYDDQLREAYVNRMQNQRTLANNLAQAGIRGGASETANLKLATTYENSRNDINKSRNAAIAEIDKNANDAIYNYRITQEAAKQEYIQNREAEERQIAETKRQEQWQAQQTKQANDEKRYAATISGWTSISKINKLIKKIQKSGKDTWRVKYLRAQRAVLEAKKKKESKKKKKK